MPEPTPRKSTNRLAVPAVDGLAEDPFDRLTRMASRLLAAPIAAVSFTGKIAMRLRSQIGLGGRDLPETLLRATLMGGEPLLISDAKADPRFATDPALGGSTPLRAYGGVPLRRPDGGVTGVFCVLDRSPRPFTPDQVKTLKYLAAIAEDEIAKGAGEIESASAPAATPVIDPNGMPSARPGESVEVAEMRRLFSSLDTPVFIHHSLDDGLGSAINGVNDAACDLLGYTRGSLLKSSITELFFHSHPGWLEEIDRMLAMPCDVVFKILLRSAVGAPIPVEVNTRLVQNAGPIRAYTVITRLAEERGNAQPGDGPPIAETAQGLLCRFQPDGTLTFVNDAYCEYYGEERRALEGFIFRPPTVDADRAISQDTIDSIRPEHPTATCEFRVFGRDGRAGWQRWTYTGLFDDTGRIIEYQALGNGFHREMANVLPVPPLPLPEATPAPAKAAEPELAVPAAPAAPAAPVVPEASDATSDTVAEVDDETDISATALIATSATGVSAPTRLVEPVPAVELEPEPAAPRSFAPEAFPAIPAKPVPDEPVASPTEELAVAADAAAETALASSSVGSPPAPAPAAVEPPPVAADAAPAVVEPVPAVVEPAPAVVEPVPAVVEPAPAAVEPAPAVVDPAPAVVEPAPAVVEPAPAVVEPAPAVVEPAPAVVEPAPAFVEPAPAVVEPAPVAGEEVSKLVSEPTPAPDAAASAEELAPPEAVAAESVAAPVEPPTVTGPAAASASAAVELAAPPAPTREPAPRGQPLQDDTIPAAILDAIDDGVFVASVAEQRLVYLNHGAQKLTGRHASAFLAAPDLWKEVFHEDDEPQLRRALKMLLEQNRAEATARVVRPNGEIVWVQLRTRLVHDEESQVPRIEGVVRDVTERRRAEDALRASEAKFRDMALNTPGVVFQWHEREGGHSGFTYMSPRLQELFAIPAEEAHTLVDRIHSSDREQWRNALAAVRTNPGPWSFEGRLVCPDGRVRWLQCAAKPVRYSPGDLLFNGVMLDITERRRTEGELRASEERFRLVLQASHDGIWDWDLTSRRVYYSDRWKEMLGYAPHELPDHLRTYYRLLAKADRKVVRQALRNHIRRGEPFSFQARFLHRDGEARWFLCRGEVQRDVDRRAVRLVGIHTDITTSKRTEEALRAAKETAEAADRSKNEFLAVMSHEIRTPMNGILGFTDLLLGSELTEEQRDYVQTIRTSSDSLMSLLNDILDLSKIEAGGVELENRSIELEDFLEEVVESHRPRATEKALALTMRIDAHAPDSVVVDAAKLRQILNNLVNNAIKFTAQGQVQVEVLLAGRENESGVPGRGLEHVLYSLEFRVTDTGIGIQPDRLGRLFKAFSQADSSSTRRYGGMGLGLVIAQRLCALMGGVIKAKSTVGKGSTFSFTLALPGEKRIPAPAGASDTAILFDLPTGPRVLVAEDNPVNQKLIRAMLKRLGLVADYALNGLDVLELCMDRRPYDIVFMDVHMPAMDGLMATRRLREMERERGANKRTYIIALTADAMPGDREKCLEAGVDDYLTKPFSQSDLSEALERARRATKA